MKYFIILFITMFTVSYNLIGMHPKKFINQAEKFVQGVGNFLLHPRQDLIAAPQIPLFLQGLPSDVTNYILQLLQGYLKEDTLESVQRTIESLAGVNRSLFEYLNSPQFCSNIITTLSMRFTLPHEKICERFNLQGIRLIDSLQDKLSNLCYKSLSKSIKEIDFEFNSLLQKGCNINFTYNGYYTPLLLCAESGHPYLMQLLLNNKANVEARNFRGCTALIQAIRGNSLIDRKNEDTLTIISLLLQHISLSNLLQKDTENVDALSYAIQIQNIEIIKLLLQKLVLLVKNRKIDLQDHVNLAQATGNAAIIAMVQDISFKLRPKN